MTKSKKSVKLYIPDDNILGAFYNAIRNNTAKTGVKYTLERIESAMLAEGMIDKKDCI